MPENELIKQPTLKEVFELAFAEMQTDPKASLVAWGKANPSSFYPLAVKIITSEVPDILDTNTVNIAIVKKNKDDK